jgi:hypothetical protein
VTDTEQLAPAASELPQVLVWIVKLEPFVPPTATLLTVALAFPVLVTVTLCAVLVWPAAAVKLSDADESVSTAFGAEPPEELAPLPQPVSRAATIPTAGRRF